LRTYRGEIARTVARDHFHALGVTGGSLAAQAKRVADIRRTAHRALGLSGPQSCSPPLVTRSGRGHVQRCRQYGLCVCCWAERVHDIASAVERLLQRGRSVAIAVAAWRVPLAMLQLHRDAIWAETRPKRPDWCAARRAWSSCWTTVSPDGDDHVLIIRRTVGTAGPAISRCARPPEELEWGAYAGCQPRRIHDVADLIAGYRYARALLTTGWLPAVLDSFKGGRKLYMAYTRGSLGPLPQRARQAASTPRGRRRRSRALLQTDHGVSRRRRLMHRAVVSRVPPPPRQEPLEIRRQRAELELQYDRRSIDAALIVVSSRGDPTLEQRQRVLLIVDDDDFVRAGPLTRYVLGREHDLPDVCDRFRAAAARQYAADPEVFSELLDADVLRDLQSG